MYQYADRSHFMEITTDKTFSGLFRRDGRFVTKFVYDMLQKFDLNLKKRVIVVGIIHGVSFV